MPKFKVGQKVKCIAEFVRSYGSELLPEKEQIYTVRDNNIKNSAIPCVRLEEVRNLPEFYRQGFIECGFDEEGFEVVDEIKNSKKEVAFKKVAMEYPIYTN